MQIQCPECGFSRHVPDDKLPATATLATCPKCGHKFRFRDAPAQHAAQASEPATAESGATAVSEPDARPESMPDTPPVEPTTSGRDDIWRKLEAMDPGKEPPPFTPDDEPSGDGLETGDNNVPWETAGLAEAPLGLLDTIRLVMFAPAEFFGAMLNTGWPTGFVRPLTFYVLLMVFQILVQYGYEYLGLKPLDFLGLNSAPEPIAPVPADPMAGPTTGPGAQPEVSFGSGALSVLAVAPALLTIALIFVSGLTHLLLKLVQAEKRGLEATFRGAAYGAAPCVLVLVPYVGQAAAAIWSMVVTVIAYKHLHRTQYWRVIVAMLLPLAIGLTAYILSDLFGNSVQV